MKDNIREIQLQADPSGLLDLIIAIALFGVIVISRIANRGSLYFVDGPGIAGSIRRHTFVVQPPGYWAFAHLGGLFQNPATGLAFWNILFSALGVVVMYLLCRELRSERALCFAAAVAFGSVYFVWFAGEIHSSYASQILFPPLSLYCFLRYKASQKPWWSLLWALSSAIGMALRPSDGVFLLPLALYMFWRFVPNRKVWIQYWGIMLVSFLAWYIPSRYALEADHRRSNAETLLVQMRLVSPLLTGLNQRSLANLSRVFVPLLIALWPLLPALFVRRDSSSNRIAIFWVVPGLAFFCLCYIADPTYLIFLCGAWFWLVITSHGTRQALIVFVICAVFNTALFLTARPLHGTGPLDQLYNFYVVKYCRYGINHRWSSTLGRGGMVP